MTCGSDGGWWPGNHAEAAVGVPLFERQARGVRPTPAGAVLLRHARKVVAHLEAAYLEIAGLRDRLAVSAYPAASAVAVPRAIARLRAEHPRPERPVNGPRAHSAGARLPLRRPCMVALGSFRPVISTCLPRDPYLVVIASSAATVEASQMCAADRSIVTCSGSAA